jgi:hypothetical protein
MALHGRASNTLNGTVGLQIAEIDGHQVAFLAPRIQCDNIIVHVKENGALQLGAIIGFQPFNEAVGETVIADSIPTRTPLASRSEKPEGKNESADKKEGGGKDVIVRPPHPAVDLTVIPREGRAKENGFIIAADTRVVAANTVDVDETVQKRRKELHEKLKKHWANAGKPRCPEPADLRVEVAGVEFGPNGEIVRILGEAKDYVDRVKKEVDKVLKTPGKAARDFPGNVQQEARRFCRRIGFKKC